LELRPKIWFLSDKIGTDFSLGRSSFFEVSWAEIEMGYLC